MICCDSCNIWYHLSCVGISEEQVEKMDEYFCKICVGKYQKDQSLLMDLCSNGLIMHRELEERKKKLLENFPNIENFISNPSVNNTSNEKCDIIDLREEEPRDIFMFDTSNEDTEELSWE